MNQKFLGQIRSKIFSRLDNGKKYFDDRSKRCRSLSTSLILYQFLLIFWKSFVFRQHLFLVHQFHLSKRFWDVSNFQFIKNECFLAIQVITVNKIICSNIFLFFFSCTGNCPLKTVHSINCVGFHIDASEVISWPSIWKSFLGTVPKKYFNRGTSRLIFRHCPECVFRTHKLREWCKGRSTNVSELSFYHI